MNYKSFGIIFFFLLASLGLFAQVRINVVEDTYTAGGEDASKNFGAEGKLWLKNTGNDDKFNRKVFLKFALNKAPKIEAAVLYVHARAFENVKRPNDLMEISVNVTDDNWRQGNITTKSQPVIKETIGTLQFKQSAKPDWYPIILDANQVELAKKQGWLSVCLEQSNKNALSAYISALEEVLSNGRSTAKQAYLEINGKLPEINPVTIQKSVKNVAPSPIIKEAISVKLLTSGDISLGESTAEFTNPELLVRGSHKSENTRETYLAYDMGQIKDYILKATFYVYVKSPKTKAGINFYEGKGDPVNKETSWKNRPVTAAAFAELEVPQGNEFKLYEFDVSEYARLNQVRGNKFLTICAREYAKLDVPIYLGAGESENNHSYLVVNTVSRDVLKGSLPVVQAPAYPDGKENPAIFEKWIKQHPVSGKQWVPEIYKKYISQNGISRLYDFSYAGYAYGEKPIPDIKGITLNVKDLGALPNDDKDDTDAIQQALDKISKKGGVLFFPKGKYIINGNPEEPKALALNASNVVIRGEGSGPDGTVLFMTNKYLPAKGFGDFVFTIGKTPVSESIARTPVIKTANRGSFRLEMKDTDKFSVGDQIQITMYSEKDTKSPSYRYNTELSQILTYPLPPDLTWSNFGKHSPYSCYNQIVGIEGKVLILKQPLKVAIDLKFKPQVAALAFYENIGVENIRIEGNWKGPYTHHGSREMDYGWCGLAFFNTANSWVKNMTFENLTCDIKFWKSKNITADGIRVSGSDGHHGIAMNTTSAILIKNSSISAHRTHHLGISGSVEGCVFRDIEVTDSVGMIDFHGGGFAIANLYENIKNMSVSGGGSIKNMPHSGRENTFWNMTSNHKGREKVLTNQFFQEGIWNYDWAVKQRGSISLDCYQLYPASVVVGVYKSDIKLQIGNSSSDRDTDYVYVEGLNKPETWPVSLYDAQLDFRINRNKYLSNK